MGFPGLLGSQASIQPNNFKLLLMIVENSSSRLWTGTQTLSSALDTSVHGYDSDPSCDPLPSCPMAHKLWRPWLMSFSSSLEITNLSHL